MKAVIVGGGLGGIAAAIRLRAQGWDVTLCENGPSLGGKMNRWRAAGYVFDTGPSLITMPWVFADLYRVAGAQIEEHVELVRVDPSAEYVFADGSRIRAPDGLAPWVETIRQIEPRDVDGFLRLRALGGKLYELSRRTFFRRSPLSFPEKGELSALRYLPIRHGWGNYARTIEAYLRSPYLRQIYNRYPTYVGSSPYLCPATLIVIPYIEQEFGGWYVKGGLYRIVETLEALAERNGVEIRTGTRVASIEHRDRRVRAVILENGARLAADVVVLNGDAANAPELLGERTDMDAADRSLSAVVLLAGVRRKLPGLGQHTVYFSGDYRSEFEQLFCARVFPPDPTVYVNIPSRVDPSVAPPDGETVFVMANAPAGGTWDHAETQRALDRIFARLAAGGFPDIRAEAEVFDVWNPTRLARRYLSPDGAIYGTNSHGWRRAFFRPPCKDRRYAGLYYVGGSSHPGGGTPMVLLSAQIATRLIQKYEEGRLRRSVAGG
jgi:phytoene desaturase